MGEERKKNTAMLNFNAVNAFLSTYSTRNLQQNWLPSIIVSPFTSSDSFDVVINVVHSENEIKKNNNFLCTPEPCIILQCSILHFACQMSSRTSTPCYVCSSVNFCDRLFVWLNEFSPTFHSQDLFIFLGISQIIQYQLIDRWNESVQQFFRLIVCPNFNCYVSST